MRRTSYSQENEQIVQCFKRERKNNNLPEAQDLGASITVIFTARLWATRLTFKAPFSHLPSLKKGGGGSR